MHFRYFDWLIQISSEFFESWILVCSQLLLFRVQRLRSNWDKFRNFMLESFSIVAAFWDPAYGLFRIPATLWSYLLLRGIRDSLSLSLSLSLFLSHSLSHSPSTAFPPILKSDLRIMYHFHRKCKYWPSFIVASRWRRKSRTKIFDSIRVLCEIVEQRQTCLSRWGIVELGLILVAFLWLSGNFGYMLMSMKRIETCC